MNIILTTPQLFLRQFTEDDAPLIYILNKDPEIVKYVHEPVLENEEQAKNILTNIILPQYKNHLGRWAVYTKSDNIFIGWCGLKYLPGDDSIDLGYRLIKSHWGKGLATEAAQYTLEHGFKNLELNVIRGRAHIENVASQKVMEKIGMKFVKEEIDNGCPVKTYTAALIDNS
ncbi:MAG: GNAT family N-acetyltransferase [Ginsengibacter sp.]